VSADILKSVGKAFTALPQEFTPHRQIKKVYEQRRAMIESGTRCCCCTSLLFSGFRLTFVPSNAAPRHDRVRYALLHLTSAVLLNVVLLKGLACLRYTQPLHLTALQWVQVDI
jgi:hypothetical protein